MTKILMFSGQIGSGKGFVSAQKISKLKEVGNTIVQISFANPIKKIVDAVCGFDKNLKHVRQEIDTQLNEIQFSNIMLEAIQEKVIDEIDDFFNGSFSLEEFSKEQELIIEELYSQYLIVKESGFHSEIERKEAIRKMYQLFGTELCQPINKTIWAVYVSAKIANLCFENEIDYIIIDDFRFIMEFFTMVALLPQYKIIPYAIIASKKIRAVRRNITIEELEDQCKHLSEREFEIIHEWMKMRYPENIIVNN